MNKAVNPTGLTTIGGFTNPPAMSTEFVPPSNVDNKVEHRFHISNVNIKAWSTVSNGWVNYHPYEALGSDSFMDTSINPSNLKIGYWQKQGKEYNKMRLLSNDPFSFTNHSPNNFVPEQIGMTAGTLFCKANEKSWHCEKWNLKQFFTKEKNTKYKELLIKPIKENASVVTFQNVFNIPYSIKMSNHSRLEILMPESVLECKIKMFSYAKEVKISFYGLKDITVFEENEEGVKVEKAIGREYIIVQEKILKSLDWLVDITYSDENISINKICIEPIIYNIQQASTLKNQIRELELLLLEGIPKTDKKKLAIKKLSKNIKGAKIGAIKAKDLKILKNKIQDLELVYLKKDFPKIKTRNDAKRILRNTKRSLAQLTSITCPKNTLKEDIKEINAQIKELEEEQKGCSNTIESAQDKKNQFCSIAKEKEELLNMCFLDGKCCIKNNNKCLEYLKEQNENSSIIKLIHQISLLNDKYCEAYAKYVSKLHSKLENDYEIAKENCDKWSIILDDKLKECKEISDKLNGLNIRLEQIQQEDNIDKCATYIHQICWLTEEEIHFNRSIPSQAALEAEYDAMRLANKVIAPIWKPEMHYCIEVETREEISGRTDANEKYYIQFKTEGPIGHFSLENLSKTVKEQFKLNDNSGERQENNEDFDQFIDVPELSLRSYINYKISYPNPSGNIINAKPLYYEKSDVENHKPTLELFYTHPFVYHMFNKWPDYNDLGESDCEIEIRVKDPTENFGIKQSDINADNQHLSPVLTQLPATKVTWEKNDNSPIPKGIEAINNLRNPKIKNVEFEGHTCWQIGGDPIIPFHKDMEVTVEHLLPSKLYNAIVFSKYDGKSKNIHSYPFQTSRFANLHEHIESYKLKGKAGDTKNAVYTIELDLGNTITKATSKIVKILLIAIGMEAHYPYSEEILQTYPNDCERLIREYLPGLKEMLPPVGTEFNLLVEPKTNHFIGTWIRSTEPLNDPRIPTEIVEKSIIPYYENLKYTLFNKTGVDFDLSTQARLKTDLKALFNSSWLQSHFVSVYSIDRTQVLILNMGKTSLPIDLKIKFDYLLWDNNKQDYEIKQNHTTNNLINP